MAKITFKGIDEYSKRLELLGTESREIIERAAYEGAGVVADEIKKGLNDLPVQEGDNGLPPVAHEGGKLTGVSRRQKADLIESFGLAPMEDNNGYINTRAGFDGYGSVKTQKYPKGTPNAMLMRSVESGTSFREKYPTVRPAVNRARKKAERTMADELDRQIEKRFK